VDRELGVDSNNRDQETEIKDQDQDKDKDDDDNKDKDKDKDIKQEEEDQVVKEVDTKLSDIRSDQFEDIIDSDMTYDFIEVIPEVIPRAESGRITRLGGVLE
jgi:vacuolar-type H+-ATPase subunit I/STV1